MATAKGMAPGAFRHKTATIGEGERADLDVWNSSKAGTRRASCSLHRMASFARTFIVANESLAQRQCLCAIVER